jgi:hypothetical protein
MKIVRDKKQGSRPAAGEATPGAPGSGAMSQTIALWPTNRVIYGLGGVLVTIHGI